MYSNSHILFLKNNLHIIVYYMFYYLFHIY